MTYLLIFYLGPSLAHIYVGCRLTYLLRRRSLAAADGALLLLVVGNVNVAGGSVAAAWLVLRQLFGCQGGGGVREDTIRGQLVGNIQRNNTRSIPFIHN